jgi:hypothetical protein
MLFQRLAQFDERILVMSRVEDDWRLAPHNLKAGRPCDPSKPLLNSFI